MGLIMSYIVLLMGILMVKSSISVPPPPSEMPDINNVDLQAKPVTLEEAEAWWKYEPGFNRSTFPDMFKDRKPKVWSCGRRMINYNGNDTQTATMGGSDKKNITHDKTWFIGREWLKDQPYTNGLSWGPGVRLNEIQVVGTHNSYHVEAVGKARRKQRGRPEYQALRYSHMPLGYQLTCQSVRSLELDVWRGTDFERTLRVLHKPDWDSSTNCHLLADCLHEIKDFLDANPRSVPITVMVTLSRPILAEKRPDALLRTIHRPDFDKFEKDVRTIFPAHRLITPDDVSVDGLTINESIRKRGWPTLESSRGRVIFWVDGISRYKYVTQGWYEYPWAPFAYRKRKSSLKGRVAFISSKQTRPECAIIKVDNPKREKYIRRLVKHGYLVRTRADKSFSARRRKECSTERRDRALRSGAQIVSTDYPSYSNRWGCEYSVQLPGRRPVRCNPVNSGLDCHDDELE